MRFEEFVELCFARAKKEGFEDCEAYFASGDSFEASVFEGSVIEYSASSSLGVGFRGLIKGKMGYASTQVLDAEAVELLVLGAKTNAEMIENDDVQFIYAGDETYPEVNAYNPALDEVSAAEKIDMGLKLEKATLACDPRIGQVQQVAVMSSKGESRIINTKGLNLRFAQNSIGLYTSAVAKENERVNVGEKMVYTRDAKALDIEAMAQVAANEALAMLNAAPVPSGTYRVALRNDTMAIMLALFNGIFDADDAQKGMSLLYGKENERIASEIVTILDDPHNPAGMNARPYDAEGVATKKKAVVDKGVLTTLLHNLKTAHKQGIPSTGNAAKGSYAAPVTIAPSNFYIMPTDMQREALLALLNDGLFVTELSGFSGCNPISGDFSLSAKGYRVENGALTEPVDQITVAGNFFELLKDIEAVASDLDLRPMGGGFFGSPTVLVKSLSIAGT